MARAYDINHSHNLFMKGEISDSICKCCCCNEKRKSIKKEKNRQMELF